MYHEEDPILCISYTTTAEPGKVSSDASISVHISIPKVIRFPLLETVLWDDTCDNIKCDLIFKLNSPTPSILSHYC